MTGSFQCAWNQKQEEGGMMRLGKSRKTPPSFSFPERLLEEGERRCGNPSLGPTDSQSRNAPRKGENYKCFTGVSAKWGQQIISFTLGERLGKKRLKYVSARFPIADCPLTKPQHSGARGIGVYANENRKVPKDRIVG
jgi:hypothetical protein